MKKLFSLLVASTLILSCAIAQNLEAQPAEGAEENTGGPVMTFENTEVDYGTIEQNSEPLRTFNFTNTGDEPLIIKHAKGSCGCTVPSYPKEPILPGESAVIDVRYDTKRIGKFTKSITLTTNESAGKRVLRIRGDVKKKAPEPEAVPASTPSIFSPSGQGDN